MMRDTLKQWTRTATDDDLMWAWAVVNKEMEYRLVDPVRLWEITREIESLDV